MDAFEALEQARLRAARENTGAAVDGLLAETVRALPHEPTMAVLYAGFAHLTMFELTGDPADLQAARQDLDRLRHAPDGTEPVDLLLERLGEVGGLHFMDTGDVHSRDLSIAALVELTDRDTSSVTALHNLCVVLQARLDATGEVTDADLLIDRARRLHALALAGDDRWTAEWIIAGGLFARHRLRQDPVGLTEAITLYRTAAAHVPTADSRSAEVLSMLIRALIARFDVLGASDDIHEATLVADRLDALPVAPGSGGVLVNAAHALSAAYERTADPGFAIRAADLIRHGRALMSPGDPQFRATSSALASALVDEAAVDPGNRPKLLAEAVTAARDATALPAGHRDRAAYLTRYADLLLQASPESVGHLDMAVTAARAAVQEARTGAAEASALTVLARALQRSGTEPATLVALWAQAAGLDGLPDVLRVRIHHDWAGALAAAGEHERATHPYTVAVDVMNRLAWTGLSRGDAEHRLTAWPTIAVDAAASATAGGTATQAVQLLEDGRAVLWSRHLRMRPQTGPLRAIRPDVADRVDGVAAQLRHPAASS